MKTRFNKGIPVCLWLLVVGSMLLIQPAMGQTPQDQYALAANHYSRTNWDESVVAFEELIARHPQSDEAIAARFFLAEIMMQRGQFTSAYRTFQIFLQENPGHQFGPRATFRMGEAAYRTGQHEVAIRLLEEFIREHPHHALTEFALPYLGEMRLEQDEPQLAQRAFETSLRIFPTSSMSNSSRLGLAKALQRTGNEEEAQRFYQFLLTQNKGNLLGQAHLQLGIMSFKQANHSVAKDHLQRAISNCESKETKAEATYWLARVFVYANDNERALELLKTIVNLDIPEELRVAVLYDGAVAASKAGDDSLALRWLAVIRKRYPKNQLADSSIRMEIDIHQRRGESDKALVLIKRFRNEHKQSPMRTSVLESEGRSHYAEKRYEEMIQTFELLLAETRGDKTIEPADRANWRYLKSLGYLGLNDYEQAEVELNRIDVLAQSRQLKPLVQIALATSRFRLKKYSAAILNYREYLRLSESGAEQKRARAELTICLAYAGRWDEAADAFEDLNVHHADDPMLFATMKFLAERSYYEKKLDHAQRWFTLMSRPGNPKEMITSGLSGLAWISVKSQDLQSANDVFERLLNECPDEKSSGDAALARAKFLEDQKDFEQAAITYGLVIRQIHAPELSSVAKLRRAYCLQKMGGIDHLEESKTLLQDYLALPSANPLADEAMYQLAWVLHDLGQPDECYKMFKELVESEPASKYWPDAAYRVIKDAISKRDLETAKSLSAKLLSRSDVPDEVTSRVLFVQGQIAVQENQWSGVAKSMRELASRTDDDKLKSKAEYWLAESLYRQKKYEDALKIYERLASPVGMIDKKLEPWLLLRTAQCQGQADDWSSAMSSATKAKKRFPDFESNYEFDFIHGRGLEDAGKLTDAREAYQLVIDSTKGGSTETAAIAQWRIGETYFHQEDYVNAIKSYHKVDSLFSYGHWRSAALFQAGKCQEHLKNDKHAIKLYTQLIESFPDSSFAAGARKRLDRLTAQAKAMTTGTTAETNPGKNRR